MEREATGLRLELGSSAPYFSLKGTDGKIYSLEEFRDSKILVILFTCNHCPYAQAYEQRICTLAELYRPQGVQFVGICSNDSRGYPQDSYENMVEKSKALGFPFPYLHDETQITAKAYDAACTPEAYVFDSERKLRYHGRIDDNYRDPSHVTKADLADAIEAILDGRRPEAALTGAIGCSIKWKA
jgi:peroxiredoxin